MLILPICCCSFNIAQVKNTSEFPGLCLFLFSPRVSSPSACRLLWQCTLLLFLHLTPHACILIASPVHYSTCSSAHWSCGVKVRLFSCHSASGFSFPTVLVLLSHAQHKSATLQISKHFCSVNALLILDSSIASLSDLSQIPVKTWLFLFSGTQLTNPFCLRSFQSTSLFPYAIFTLCLKLCHSCT